MQKSFSALLITSLTLLSACSVQIALPTAEKLKPVSQGQVIYEGVLDSGRLHSKMVLADVHTESAEERSELLQTLDRPKVVTVGSGDPENRINIVFVGDGYTQEDLEKYRRQVDAVIQMFLQTSPMVHFKNHFLFHRVEVLSRNEGISDSSKGIQKETPLRMLRGCHGIERLICIDTQRAAHMASFAPRADMIFAMANTFEYGGAGYRNPAIATFSGDNLHSFELALHEFGHSFADLADEYEYAGSDSESCTKKANASLESAASMLASKTKWFRWLDLPEVDSFRGGCYSTTAFRPTIDSKMRTLGQPFDVVSSEQVVLKIFEKVQPIDSFTPEGNYRATGTLHVFPIPSASAMLKWYVNGNEATEHLNQNNVRIDSLGLRKGKNTIEARFLEGTTFVRDLQKRQQFLEKNLKWTLQKLK